MRSMAFVYRALFIMELAVLAQRIDAVKLVLQSNQRLPGYDVLSKMQAEALANLVGSTSVRLENFTQLSTLIDTCPFASPQDKSTAMHALATRISAQKAGRAKMQDYEHIYAYVHQRALGLTVFGDLGIYQ